VVYQKSVFLDPPLNPPGFASLKLRESEGGLIEKQ